MCKRATWLVFIIALLVLWVVGCVQTAPAPPAPAEEPAAVEQAAPAEEPAPAEEAAEAGSIKIWSRQDLQDTTDPNSVTLKEKIAAFEAETGITVVYEQVAFDQLATKLALAVQSGGDVPDVVEAGSQHIPSLIDAGAIMALDDLLKDEPWVAELTEGDKAACVVGGVRYCVATNVRGGITYYRNADFPDGFPETSEGWLQEGARLKEAGKYLSTFYAGRGSGAIEVGWWPFIAANGGRIFDDEGKPAWASPEVVEVVEFGRQMLQQGYLPEADFTGDFADAEAPWIEGQSASFRGGSWSSIFVPGLQEQVDKGEVGTTGGIRFGDGEPHVFLVSESWVVAEGSQNPEGARAWLRSFMQPEFLAKWAEAQYGIPTTQAAYEAGQFGSGFYKTIDEILSSQGLYMEQSPYYNESLDALAIAFQEMMLDPKIDALERLQRAQDEVLNRYW